MAFYPDSKEDTLTPLDCTCYERDLESKSLLVGQKPTFLSRANSARRKNGFGIMMMVITLILVTGSLFYRGRASCSSQATANLREGDDDDIVLQWDLQGYRHADEHCLLRPVYTRGGIGPENCTEFPEEVESIGWESLNGKWTVCIYENEGCNSMPIDAQTGTARCKPDHGIVPHSFAVVHAGVECPRPNDISQW